MKNIAMTRRLCSEDVEDVGDYFFAKRGDADFIYLMHPSPLDDDGKTLVLLRVDTRGPQGRPIAWGWNGDQDKPTIVPSIHTFGHWHGWVRKGELVTA